MTEQDLQKLKENSLDVESIVGIDLPDDLEYMKVLQIFLKQQKLISDEESRAFNERLQVDRFKLEREKSDASKDLELKKFEEEKRVNEQNFNLKKIESEILGKRQELDAKRFEEEQKIREQELSIKKAENDISLKRHELDAKKFDEEKLKNNHEFSIKEKEYDISLKRYELDKDKQDSLLEIEKAKLEIERTKLEFEKKTHEMTIESQKSEREFKYISLIVTSVVTVVGVVVPLIVYKKLAYANLKLIYKDEGRPTQDFKDTVRCIKALIR